MRVFVPVEDSGIDHEGDILVPYQCGIACAHELRGALVLRDGVWRERTALNDESASHRQESIPACPPDRR